MAVMEGPHLGMLNIIRSIQMGKILMDITRPAHLLADVELPVPPSSMAVQGVVLGPPRAPQVEVVAAVAPDQEEVAVKLPRRK